MVSNNLFKISPLLLAMLIAGCSEDGSSATPSPGVGDAPQPAQAGKNSIFTPREAVSGGTLSIVSAPENGTLTVNDEGSLTFEPGEAFTGLAKGETKTITFIFSDGTTEHTSYIKVTGVNDKPLTESVKITEQLVDSVFTGQLEASDPDEGDAISFSVINQPDPTLGTVIVDEDGSFVFTPAANFPDLAESEEQEVSFTYVVSDGSGASSDPAKATLIITGGDFGDNTRPEVADVAPMIVPIGGTVDGKLEMSDADGDTLEAKLVSQPDKGSLTFNPDGTFSYDPGADFTDLPKGELAKITFTYQVIDSSEKANSTSGIKTVTITVTGESDIENNQPIAQAVSVSVTADGVSTVNGSFSVLGVDVNDIGLHSYQIDSDDLLGSVKNNNDGSFTYTPGSDFSLLAKGSVQLVTFSYTASKGNGISLPAFVTVEVTGINETTTVNNQPSGLDQSYSLILDGNNLTDKAFDVIDLDADIKHTIEITQPTKDLVTDGAGTINGGPGSVINNNDGTFTFVPGTDFNHLFVGQKETVSFTYVVIDSSGAVNNRSVKNTISIEVEGLNSNARPVVADVTMSVLDGAVAELNLSATDDDGTDTFLFTTVTPTKGQVLISGTTLTFDPANDFVNLSKGESQEVSFTYTANDGSTASNAESIEATVTVTVTGKNDQPEAKNNSHSTTQGGLAVEGRLSLRDDDLSDTLTFEITKLPEEGVLDKKGTAYTFDPKDDFKWLAEGVTEDFTFEYEVIDQHDLRSEPGIITISITGINDAPVAVADTYPVNEGETIVIAVADGVLKNDSDIDKGDVITAELVTDVVNGTLTLNADGSFTYIHDGSETISDSFEYKVKDAKLSDNTLVSIVVTPQRDHKVVNTTENSLISVDSVIPDDEVKPTGNMNYELVTDIDAGRLTLNSDGSFEFDPASNFNDLKAGEIKTLTFTYKMTDLDTGLFEEAEVSIDVLGEADIDFELTSEKILRADDGVSYDISAYGDKDISISVAIANDPRAKYRNSFGYYFANSLGEPISGELLMVNSYDSSGVSGARKVFATIIANDLIPAGATSVGFFLVPNGGHNDGDYSDTDSDIYNPGNNVVAGYENGAKLSFENESGVWVAKTASNHSVTGIGPAHGSLRGGCTLASSDNQLIFSNPALNYDAGTSAKYSSLKIAGDFTAWAEQDMIFDGCNAWTKVISTEGSENFKFIVDTQATWYGASAYTKVNLASGAGDITLPTGEAFYDVTVYDAPLWLVVEPSEVEPLDVKLSQNILDQEGKDMRSSASQDDYIFGDMPGINDIDDLYLTYNVVAGNNFASNGDEYITGGVADDLIDARGGNDILITGKGSDVMTGGSSYIDSNGLPQDDDLFVWLAGDHGTDAVPDEDIILDYGIAGGNDDALDLSALVSTCSPAASCISVAIVKDTIASGGGIKEGDTLLTITPDTDAKVTISLQGWGAADWFAAYPNAGWVDVDDVVASPERLIEALIDNQNLFITTRL